MNVRLILVAFICLITNCVCLENGAPISACSSLLPNHLGIKPQQGSSPYAITANKIGENKVVVTISASPGVRFQGFILQARSAADRNKFIAGEFKSGELSKAIDCNRQKQSTLTHTSAIPKEQVTTEWTSVVNEDVVFRATVAEQFTIFWENLDSEPVIMKTDEKVISTEKEPDEHPVYEDCLASNRCVGMPHDCIEKEACEILLTHGDNHDGSIRFTMYGMLNSTEYMAMGLSEDNIMGEDFVTECFRIGENDVKLRNSWNEGKSNTRTTEVSDKFEFAVSDGLTTCAWTRKNVLDFNGRMYDLFNEKYYILLAKGRVSNGKIGYHTSKLASSEPAQFYSSSETTDSIETTADTTEFQHETTDQPEELTTISTSTDKEITSGNGCSLLNPSLFCLVVFGLYACGWLKLLF